MNSYIQQQQNIWGGLDNMIDNLKNVINNEKLCITNAKESVWKQINNYNNFKISYNAQAKQKKDNLKKLYDVDLNNNTNENIKNKNYNYEFNQYLSLLKNKENEVEVEFSNNKTMKIKIGYLLKFGNSKLASYFNGKAHPPYKNKHIFLDRDIYAFNLLLTFIKNCELPKFINENEKNIFFNEMNFWGIKPKIPAVEILRFDINFCPSFFNIDKSNRTLTKTNSSKGIVILKRKLNLMNPYIEFSITLNNQHGGGGKILLALIDSAKFKKSYLNNSFEKEAPYILLWDIFNNKLFKKIGEKYPKLEISDNCKCNSYENKYAVKYDHQYNTIELFRNDINLGVVVQNIKPYLTPALEINLEDCKIQLSSKNLPQEKIYL